MASSGSPRQCLHRHALNILYFSCYFLSTAWNTYLVILLVFSPPGFRPCLVLVPPTFTSLVSIPDTSMANLLLRPLSAFFVFTVIISLGFRQAVPVPRSCVSLIPAAKSLVIPVPYRDSLLFCSLSGDGTHFLNEGWVVVVAGGSCWSVSNNFSRIVCFLDCGPNRSGEGEAMFWSVCVCCQTCIEF